MRYLPPTPRTGRRATALCACLAALAGLPAGTAAQAATVRQMPIETVAPLLADDGTSYPAARRGSTAEAAAGGAAPGWATPAQREQLRHLHPQRVVRLHAGPRDAALPRLPAADAWVFVDGPDEAAVRLARRLAAAGVEHVWVELPGPTAGAAPLARNTRRGQP